jgi:hypothetical protein
MKDQCKADADTRVPIPGSELVFMPPKNWIYAKLEEASLAQQGEKGAVLVLTTFAPDKGPKLNKQRGELTVSLAELVGIDPAGPVTLANPNSRSEIAGLDMSLWERSGSARAGEAGALLILSAADGERELFGIGFAPKDDADGTKAILDTLNTLERGGKAAPKPDDGK